MKDAATRSANTLPSRFAMYAPALPFPAIAPWRLPVLPRWLRPTQELRIDVQSPSATPQPDELKSLYARLHNRRDALFGASVVELPLPGLRVYCREADGELYLYVEDVQACCLAGYTVLNRLVEVSRRADAYVRAPHSKYAEPYQRRGIATALYRWALGRGLCLLSGARQSPAAHALWHKLARDYRLHHVTVQHKTLHHLGPEVSPDLLDDLHTRLLLLGQGWDLARFASATQMQMENQALTSPVPG